MTDCNFGIIASRYHDGELAPRQVYEFEAHLAQCPACRAQLHDYARLDEFMDLGRDAAPGTECMSRLRQLPDSTAPARLWLDAARLGRILIPRAPVRAAADGDTPLLGAGLSETEQQYLFADEGAAIAGLYQTTGNE